MEKKDTVLYLQYDICLISQQPLTFLSKSKVKVKVKGNNSYSQTYHSEHYGEKGHSIIFTV